MIPIPTKYFLTTGSSEGFMPLNAFDQALLNAGIGNTNLIKMSSIIPPDCQRLDSIHLPYGALVPVAYASRISQIPGEIISAAVACAFPMDKEKPGLIMEYSATGHKEEVEAIVIKMTEEGMRSRGEELKEIESVSISHQVEHTGAAFAAVVLWY